MTQSDRLPSARPSWRAVQVGYFLVGASGFFRLVNHAVELPHGYAAMATLIAAMTVPNFFLNDYRRAGKFPKHFAIALPFLVAVDLSLWLWAVRG